MSNIYIPSNNMKLYQNFFSVAAAGAGLSCSLRMSLVNNYDKTTGPLLPWQMIEGDLINLQIDIEHQESALTRHLI